MTVLLKILETVFSTIGFAIGIKEKKDKGGKAIVWLLKIGLLVTFAVIWIGFYVDKKELESTERERKESIAKRDTMQMKMDEIQNMLKPFTQMAILEYPNFDTSTALNKLVTDIAEMKTAVEELKPKLVFFGNRSGSKKDTLTSLVHSYFYFRSSLSKSLRDISIAMKFNQRFEALEARQIGTIIEERGTKLTLDTDSAGFKYLTDYLREGADIQVYVVSKMPLLIKGLETNP